MKEHKFGLLHYEKVRIYNILFYSFFPALWLFQHFGNKTKPRQNIHYTSRRRVRSLSQSPRSSSSPVAPLYKQIGVRFIAIPPIIPKLHLA